MYHSIMHWHLTELRTVISMKGMRGIINETLSTYNTLIIE